MKRTNRSRGHRSPLDTKLTKEARRELGRRCAGSGTLAEIRQWLASAHGLQISKTALSDWRARRVAEGAAGEDDDVRTVLACGLEITIIAPGAESITVRVEPSPASVQEGSRA
jgi:hypothetical protein